MLRDTPRSLYLNLINNVCGKLAGAFHCKVRELEHVDDPKNAIGSLVGHKHRRYAN